MKPYSPKRKGSTRGHVSCTSKCATRERAIRQDKKAARRESVPTEEIGYVTRIGGTVHHLCKGDVWLDRPIKAPLTVGEWLVVPTLFGTVKAQVTEGGDKHATAMSGGMLCWLTFGEDDRGCWTCGATGDAEALTKGLIF